MPQFLVVGAGAALGAVARYLLSAALGGGMLPLLVINILGSALMGYFRPGPFWGTGVLGGIIRRKDAPPAREAGDPGDA